MPPTPYFYCVNIKNNLYNYKKNVVYKKAKKKTNIMGKPSERWSCRLDQTPNTKTRTLTVRSLDSTSN